MIDEDGNRVLPSWTDFRWKFGFGDGEFVEDLDYVARDFLVELLNEHLPPTLRAVAWDRPGFHNPLFIFLAKVKSKTVPTQRILTESAEQGVWEGKGWKIDTKIEAELELPEEVEDVMTEMIGEAYSRAEKRLRLRQDWRPGDGRR